jgi:hypothetical protein
MAVYTTARRIALTQKLMPKIMNEHKADLLSYHIVREVMYGYTVISTKNGNKKHLTRH